MLCRQCHNQIEQARIDFFVNRFGNADHATLCRACAAKSRKNKARRERHAAMLSLGLVRVKGALGGVYYE